MNRHLSSIPHRPLMADLPHPRIAEVAGVIRQIPD